MSNPQQDLNTKPRSPIFYTKKRRSSESYTKLQSPPVDYQRKRFHPKSPKVDKERCVTNQTSTSTVATNIFGKYIEPSVSPKNWRDTSFATDLATSPDTNLTLHTKIARQVAKEPLSLRKNPDFKLFMNKVYRIVDDKIVSEKSKKKLFSEELEYQPPKIHAFNGNKENMPNIKQGTWPLFLVGGNVPKLSPTGKYRKKIVCDKCDNFASRSEKVMDKHVAKCLGKK